MNPAVSSPWPIVLTVLTAFLLSPFRTPATGADRGVSPEDVTSDHWIGRWEDGTGYFVDISKTDKGFKLSRSGELHSELRFVGATKKELIYRETWPTYIHILKYKSEGKIQDVWVDIAKNTVSDVVILRRTK